MENRFVKFMKDTFFTKSKNRMEIFDVIRGFTLLNMIAYHVLFDVTMFTTKGLEWYDDLPGHLWQQAICCSFIFLSGMCRAIGKKSLKRGLIVSGCGLAVTLATLIAMPEELVLFGVLTFTGAAMLFVIPFEKLFKKMNPYVGLGISTLGFLLTKDVYYGYWGFGCYTRYLLGMKQPAFLRLPKFLYANVVTSFFGFPSPDFSSADYFPFLPWIFLFMMGFFLWMAIGKKVKNKKIMHFDIPGFSFMGRHSLLIYMLHQPVAFGVVYLIFNFDSIVKMVMNVLPF